MKYEKVMKEEKRKEFIEKMDHGEVFKLSLERCPEGRNSLY